MYLVVEASVSHRLTSLLNVHAHNFPPQNSTSTLAKICPHVLFVSLTYGFASAHPPRAWAQIFNQDPACIPPMLSCNVRARALYLSQFLSLTLNIIEDRLYSTLWIDARNLIVLSNGGKQTGFQKEKRCRFLPPLTPSNPPPPQRM